MLKLAPDTDHPEMQLKVDDTSHLDSVWFVEIEGLLYTTIHHPDGQTLDPWYRISGEEIYPHTGHPSGPGLLPWFKRVGDSLVSLPANIECQRQRLLFYRIVA